ncbi:MAG: hypothetical protein GY742_22680, partial [Hyphomicrobiales bacterium]|nr:hypothetical protein [Hyphomicrobiales bacterium]
KFLEEEGIEVDIQGPFLSRPRDPENGNKRVDALPMLRRPEKATEIHLDDDDAEGQSYSASHTINGHSISFKLTYGNVRFSMTGDLNNESMNIMKK